MQSSYTIKLMIRGGRLVFQECQINDSAIRQTLILPERKWVDKVIHLKVPCFEFSGIALKVISLGRYIQVGGRCPGVESRLSGARAFSRFWDCPLRPSLQ